MRYTLLFPVVTTPSTWWIVFLSSMGDRYTIT